MKNKIKALVGSAVAFAAALPQMACAELPSDVSTAISDLQGAATDTISGVMPALKAVLIAVFGFAALWLVYKVIKRGINKV